jgi:hypothetical protein|tara:strand:- start:374 stop:892 length:519 start_codon:yes stop_codon:yes gene_type:complete
LRIITIALLLLISLNSYSQPHKTPYISISVDANNLLEIKDNGRMKYQINGLDFDIEIGTIREKTTVYAFYGAFPNAYYQNYGVGIDYYFNILKNVYLYLGNQYHTVIRTGTHNNGIAFKYKRRRITDSYINPRAKISLDTKWITIDLIVKLIERNDIDVRVFEGSVGLTKRF